MCFRGTARVSVFLTRTGLGLFGFQRLDFIPQLCGRLVVLLLNRLAELIPQFDQFVLSLTRIRRPFWDLSAVL